MSTLPSRLLAIVVVLALSAWAVTVGAAVSLPDGVGDIEFAKHDITHISADLTAEGLTLSIRYAAPLALTDMNMGTVFIDVDRDAHTGGRMGAEIVVDYNFTGVISNGSVIAGDDSFALGARGTSIQGNGDTVTMVIPPGLLGGSQALRFFVASSWTIADSGYDRAPDRGFLDTATGQVVIPIPGNQQVDVSYADRLDDAVFPDLSGMRAWVEDGNLDIRLDFDHAVDAAALAGYVDTLVIEIGLDLDKRLWTGYRNALEEPPTFGMDATIKILWGPGFNHPDGSLMMKKPDDPASPVDNIRNELVGIGRLGNQGNDTRLIIGEDARFGTTASQVFLSIPLYYLGDDGDLLLRVSAFLAASGDANNYDAVPDRGAVDTQPGLPPEAVVQLPASCVGVAVGNQDSPEDSLGFGLQGDEIVTSRTCPLDNGGLMITVDLETLELSDLAFANLFVDGDGDPATGVPVVNQVGEAMGADFFFTVTISDVPDPGLVTTTLVDLRADTFDLGLYRKDQLASLRTGGTRGSKTAGGRYTLSFPPELLRTPPGRTAKYLITTTQQSFTAEVPDDEQGNARVTIVDPQGSPSLLDSAPDAGLYAVAGPGGAPQDNLPPVLVVDPQQAVSVGDSLVFRLTASDPNGDPMSFSAEGLPVGAQLLDHGDGTADFGWMPRQQDVGNLSIVFQVSDGRPQPGTDSATVAVQVLATGASGTVFATNPDAGVAVRVSLDGSPEYSPYGWATKGMRVTAQDGSVLTLPPYTSWGNNTFIGQNKGSHLELPQPYILDLDQPVFEFPFSNAYEASQGTDPDTDKQAALTNVFYWVNRIHDHYYALGFDEAAGNFQSFNFGRGGRENDRVLGFVHFGWDEALRNNATFLASPDGEFANILTLRLFEEFTVSDNTHSRNIDSAFAADVIIHELTHGLSSRLCGGPQTGSGTVLNSIQGGAMGEGWSDWYAASVTNDPDFASYAHVPGGMPMREFRLDNNPLTYAAIGRNGKPEVHDDGEIWSAALWDLRTEFIDRYGFDDGRRMVEQLVMDAMKLSPAEPSMLDMRDFILLADRESNAAANRDIIWRVFAAHGMGLSADTEGPNDPSPTEAFDIPGVPTVSLQADPQTIAVGDWSRLSWETSQAVGASITPTLGAVDATGSQRVSPEQTTTYRIEAVGTGGTSTAEATVTVVAPAAPTASLSATPQAVIAGQAVTLAWTSSGATELSIAPAPGRLDLPNGSVEVRPQVTTTYRLTASGAGGTTVAEVTVSVDDAVPLPVPTIVQLIAAPQSIAFGDSATLSWQVEGATEIRIEPGLGLVEPTESRVVAPTRTIDYELIATGPGGVSRATVTVAVTGTPAPEVLSFTAIPAAIAPGTESLLSWQVSNADEVSIDHGIGRVGSQGSLAVTPDVDTSYTLTATGPSGVEDASVTVTITHPPPTVSLTADPPVIAEGAQSTIRWDVTDATEVSIDQGVGVVASRGLMAVAPEVDTVYTLTATGPGGMQQAGVTVTVASLPTIAFSADPVTIVAGGSSRLTWQVSDANEVSIDHGIGSVALSGSVDVLPQVATSYRLTAAGDGGVATAEVQVEVLDIRLTPITVGPLSTTGDPPVALSGSAALVTTAGPDGDFFSSDDRVVFLHDLGTNNSTKLLTIGFLNGDRAVAVSETVATIPSGGPNRFFQSSDDRLYLLNDLGGSNHIRYFNIPYLSGGISNAEPLSPTTVLVGSIGDDGIRGSADDRLAFLRDLDGSGSGFYLTVGGLSGFEASRPVALSETDALVFTEGPDGTRGNADDTVLFLEDLDGSNQLTTLTVGGMVGSSVSRPVRLSATSAVVATEGPDGTIGTGDDTVVVLSQLGSGDRVIPVTVGYLMGSAGSRPVSLSPSRALVSTAGPDGEALTSDDTVVLLHDLDTDTPATLALSVGGLSGRATFRPVAVDAGSALVATAGPDLTPGTADDELVLLTGLDGADAQVRTRLAIGGLSGSDGSRPVLLSATQALILSSGADTTYNTEDDAVVLIQGIATANRLVPLNIPYLSGDFSVSLPVALSASRAVVDSAGPDGAFGSADDIVVLIEVPDAASEPICMDFQRAAPSLDVAFDFDAAVAFYNFEYKAGPDASTDVSFELVLDGSYFARVPPVLPHQSSGDLVVPDNLVNLGPNHLLLRNPVCTAGVGSCVSGEITSWGGRLCLNPRAPDPTSWFQHDAPPLDFEMDFDAVQMAYILSFMPGPRWCTSVTFDLYIDDVLMETLTLAPGTEVMDIPVYLSIGTNRISLRNPRCSTGDGCCINGRIDSWGGSVSLREAGLASHTIDRFAGGGGASGIGDGGPATTATLDLPHTLVAAPDGSLYFADAGHHRVRRIDDDGIITTVAGTGSAGSSGDGGPATSARLNFPIGLALAADGGLYISEYSGHRIRRIAPGGTITTVAGTGVAGSSGDGGLATEARLNGPQGLAVAPDGVLYIAEINAHRIRRIASDGIITTIAGDGIAGDTGDGGPANAARLYSPNRVALAPDGSLYVSENRNRLRRIGTDGIITRVLGDNQAGSSGDGGPAIDARVNFPTGLAIAPDGTIYVAEYLGYRIRRIGTDGIVTTAIGTGVSGAGGDGGPARAAQVNGPAGLAFDANGNLYIAERDGHRVRRVDAAPPGNAAGGEGP